MYSGGISSRANYMRELHGNGVGGHCGRGKTLAMVADCYFWPKMYKDVGEVV